MGWPSQNYSQTTYNQNRGEGTLLSHRLGDLLFAFCRHITLP